MIDSRCPRRYDRLEGVDDPPPIAVVPLSQPTKPSNTPMFIGLGVVVVVIIIGFGYLKHLNTKHKGKPAVFYWIHK